MLLGLLLFNTLSAICVFLPVPAPLGRQHNKLTFQGFVSLCKWLLLSLLNTINCCSQTCSYVVVNISNKIWQMSIRPGYTVYLSPILKMILLNREKSAKINPFQQHKTGLAQFPCLPVEQAAIERSVPNRSSAVSTFTSCPIKLSSNLLCF